MAIFCEKFGFSYDDYMHGTNYVKIDMMLVDSPRMLSEEDKKKMPKKAVNAQDYFKQDRNIGYDR